MHMKGISDDEYIEERKLEHIKIILDEDINYRVSTWFENIHLIHNALPEMDLDNIDTRVEFLGRVFNHPILIDSMTGGTRKAMEINRALAEVAGEYNIPVSCGSQKAGLLNKDLVDTYRVMRDVCPDCYIIGNIGGHDIVSDPAGIASEIVSMIEADALAIHLNPLQEAVQHESTVRHSRVIDAIEEAVDAIDVPIIVKETGAGISMEVAKVLESIGVAAINVAGAGGTSWSAVEVYRNMLRKDGLMADVGRTFWNWGIPTAASLIEVLSAVDIPVISSGGVRSGVDIVKSMVLGACLGGMAQPFIKAYFEGALKKFLERIIHEIRICMFLVGASNTTSLKEAGYVITGELLEWIRQRGLESRWL